MEKVLDIQPPKQALKSKKVDIWLAGNFAKGWLKDALDEAKNKGRDPRRREIIFAVCFAESYLIEWIRDIVYEGDFPKFKKFITSYKKIAAKEKWKDVVKDL